MLLSSSAGAGDWGLRWHGVLGSAGDILQDCASDPRLAAAAAAAPSSSSASSSGLALEIVGMGAGGAVGAAVAQQKQQQEEEVGGRGTGRRSVAEAAAAGKAVPLSGRRRRAETVQGRAVAVTGAMSVEGGEEGGGGSTGPARWQSEGAPLRRSVGASDGLEAHYG